MELQSLENKNGIGKSTGLETSNDINPFQENMGNFEERDPTQSLNRQETYEVEENGLKAYLVVVGSFLGLSANFGVLNSVGAIQSYLSEHQLKSYSASTISWIFSIYLYLSFAMGVVVGPWFVTKGALLPLVFGTIFLFGGFMAVANSATVWQFVMSFLCAGLGHGLCISPLVGVINQHWSANTVGRANGIASIGGSLGGVGFPLILRALYPKVGFTWSIRVLAFICLGCMVIAIALAREKYRKKLIIDIDDTNGKNTRGKLKEASRYILNLNALKSPMFSFLIFAMFCGELAYILLITYYASYAITQGMSESTSYVLLTIFNAAGILGRFIPGAMADIWGPFNIMILMMVILDLCILVIWLPFGSHIPVLYIFAVLAGLSSASILSLLPATLASVQICGTKYLKNSPNSKDVKKSIKYPLEFGQKYGLTYFFVSSGSLFGVPLASAVIGKGSKFNYNMFVLLTGLIGIVSVILWIISRSYIVKWKLCKV